MVDVGELRIVGTIDTSNVAQGLQSMKQGLDSAKSSARSTFGDMKNLGSSIKEIGSGMLKVGGIVGGTMLGLAAFSPAVAPSLARMKTEFSAMGRTIGEEFQPLFDYAADKFSEFTTWLSSDEGRGVLSTISDVVKILADNFISLGTAITNIAKNVKITIDAVFGDGTAAKIIKWIAENLGLGIAAGLIVGSRAGPLAGVVTGLGVTATQHLTEKDNNLTSKILGYGSVGAGVGALAGAPAGGIGALPGGLIGGGVGILAGVGKYFYDELYNNMIESIRGQEFEQQYYQVEDYNNRESTVANSMRYLNTGS